VSFRFDSYSKEEASMTEVTGEEREGAGKQRDEIFNIYRPMVSQGKEWRAKM
jgi:hypothetical protein